MNDLLTTEYHTIELLQANILKNSTVRPSERLNDLNGVHYTETETKLNFPFAVAFANASLAISYLSPPDVLPSLFLLIREQLLYLDVFLIEEKCQAFF